MGPLGVLTQGASSLSLATAGAWESSNPKELTSSCPWS